MKNFLFILMKVVGGVIGFFIFFGIICAVGVQFYEPPSTSIPAPDPKETTLSLISLDYEWRKAGFDNVMEADFTIKNDSGSDIKDIEITCTHFAKSGTKIDRSRKTIYEAIKKHDQKLVKGFNMGFIHSQANKTNCKVTDLVLVP